MKADLNKSCGTCINLEYLEDCNLDGFVNENNSGFCCEEHPGYANLKSFPFRKPMKCFKGGGEQ